MTDFKEFFKRHPGPFDVYGTNIRDGKGRFPFATVDLSGQFDPAQLVADLLNMTWHEPLTTIAAASQQTVDAANGRHAGRIGAAV